MQLNLERFKTYLLDSGLVSEADIANAEDEARTRKLSFGEALVSAGKLSENDLRRMQAYVLGIPFVSLPTEKIDPEVLALIPEPIARRHNIVAFKKSQEELEVAMLDPEDLEVIEFVAKKTGLRLRPRLTDVESMKSVLVQYQKNLKTVFGDIIAAESKKLDDSGDGTKLADDIPVVRIVDTLLNHALLQGASDVHIEPFERDLVVRYRIDGILHDAMIMAMSAHAGIVARIKVLARLRLDEKRLPQDGRFKFVPEAEGADESPAKGVSIRVSILPTYFGEKIVLRLLVDAAHGFSLEVLGFHGYALEWVHKAMHKTTGMILATGPTGSGKTTTLYTAVDILNQPGVNISTIEDPIEYQMPRVNQTQVKPEIGLTFAQGLRALMRQDPNIIMVGEIRDQETASLAVNASLTGHLVLSTLHTNSAAGALPRLLDMGVPSFLILSTLEVVVAQRLVRKLTPVREAHTLTPAELGKLGKNVDLERVLTALKEEKIVSPNTTWSEVQLYRPKASPDNHDGYKGRVGIYEVLTMTSSIKEFVNKGASAEQIEAEAKRAGMMTMFEDGLFKAVQGLTSIEEVLRVASE